VQVRVMPIPALESSLIPAKPCRDSQRKPRREGALRGLPAITHPQASRSRASGGQAQGLRGSGTRPGHLDTTSKQYQCILITQPGHSLRFPEELSAASNSATAACTGRHSYFNHRIHFDHRMKEL